MTTHASARAKTDPKALAPLTSKPGTLALLQSQTQFLISLLALIPSKGTFAIHKARALAAASPQLGDWNTAREALLKEHAITELVNSETPEGERRFIVYTQDEVDDIRAKALKAAEDAAKLGFPAPAPVMVPAFGDAKFASDESRKNFAAAFEALNKELLITWDVSASANLHAAVSAVLTTLSGQLCPEIPDAELIMFERLLEEIETALKPQPK